MKNYNFGFVYGCCVFVSHYSDILEGLIFFVYDYFIQIWDHDHQKKMFVYLLFCLFSLPESMQRSTHQRNNFSYKHIYIYLQLLAKIILPLTLEWSLSFSLLCIIETIDFLYLLTTLFRTSSKCLFGAFLGKVNELCMLIILKAYL